MERPLRALRRGETGRFRPGSSLKTALRELHRAFDPKTGNHRESVVARLDDFYPRDLRRAFDLKTGNHRESSPFYRRRRSARASQGFRPENPESPGIASCLRAKVANGPIRAEDGWPIWVPWRAVLPAPKGLFRRAVDARAQRREAAGTPLMWDGPAVAGAVAAEVREAEQACLLDPRLLDDFEASLVDLIEAEVARGLAACRDGVGGAVADRIFGETNYRNRLDRQLATGAAAVADVAIEEALFVAASAVAMRLVLKPVVAEPGVASARVASPDTRS